VDLKSVGGKDTVTGELDHSLWK